MNAPVWEELDWLTQEFDDALGIVRNEAMQIVAFPDWLTSQLDYDGDTEHFVLKVEMEAMQAVEDYGGAYAENQEVREMKKFNVVVEAWMLIDVEVEAESKDDARDTVFDSPAWENVDMAKELWHVETKVNDIVEVA